MIIINNIYNENCLDTLVKIPNNFIDLTITSPPYNMNLRIRNGEYCSRQIVKEFSSKYENYYDNLPIVEFYLLHKQILLELLRVSKLIFYNIAIVTGSKRAFFKLIGDYSDYLKDIIVWDKIISQPAMHELVLNRQTELILVFDKNNAISRQFINSNFARGTLSDHWSIAKEKQPNKNHRATFPEELVKRIIENFSNINDIIYDPFLGTGTTCVVAKRLKRKYIGSEINLNYYNYCKDRLDSILDKGIFD